MLSQSYVEIAMLRHADLLKEADRERRIAEALRMWSPGKSSQMQPGLTLARLSRWLPRGLRRPSATRA